jgi:hypothetical protein
MTKKFSNARKDQFLVGLEKKAAAHTALSGVCDKGKFNFAYFTVQEAGQDFGDWNHAEIVELLQKIKQYTNEPLNYWQTQFSGKNPTFVIYDQFPPNTDFTWPAHVPTGVRWARFRLDQRRRLIGFVVPSQMPNSPKTPNGSNDSPRLDQNAFYVVFFDRDHRFYKTELQ